MNRALFIEARENIELFYIQITNTFFEHIHITMVRREVIEKKCPNNKFGKSSCKMSFILWWLFLWIFLFRFSLFHCLNEMK